MVDTIFIPALVSAVVSLSLFFLRSLFQRYFDSRKSFRNAFCFLKTLLLSDKMILEAALNKPALEDKTFPSLLTPLNLSFSWADFGQLNVAGDLLLNLFNHIFYRERMARFDKMTMTEVRIMYKTTVELLELIEPLTKEAWWESIFSYSYKS